MSDVVLRKDDGVITTLTINRENARNALNLAVFSALNEHILQLQNSNQTVVIIRSKGPVFCAGNDLKERGAKAPERFFQANVITRLANLPQPVIFGIQGGCYTGGLELALAGDILIAGKSASFADTHGKFSLVPAWGMSQRLIRRVGQWKAREISFTGIPISAQEAFQIGLINHCVDDDKLDDKISEIANAIAAQSRHSVLAYKKLYSEQTDLGLSAGLAHEVFYSSGVGSDFNERVNTKFLKK